MLDIPKVIKNKIRDYSSNKNIRVSFPFDSDMEDLTSGKVISESMSFTESFCSQQELRLGLCEASHITFETFGVGNIKGKTIDVAVEYDAEQLENIIFNEPAIQDKTYEVKYSIPKKIKTIEVICEGVTASVVWFDNTKPIPMQTQVTDRATFNVEGVMDGSGYIFHMDEIDSIWVTEVASENAYIKIQAFDENTKLIDGKTVYQIPLGRFVVESCKRSETEKKRRTVDAYTQVASNDWKYGDPVNFLKTMQDENYEQDLVQNVFCLLYSEFPEFCDLPNITAKYQVEDNEREQMIREFFVPDDIHKGNENYLKLKGKFRRFIIRNDDVDSIKRLVGFEMQKTDMIFCDEIARQITTSILKRIRRNGYETALDEETIYQYVLYFVGRLQMKMFLHIGSPSGVWLTTELETEPTDKLVIYPKWYATDKNLHKDTYGEPADNYIEIEIPTGFYIGYTNPVYEEMKLYDYQLVAHEYNCSSLNDFNITIPRKQGETGYVTEQTLDEICPLQELLRSYFEISGGFGKINREGKWELANLAIGSDKFPKDTIFPATNLYPGDSGTVETFDTSQYSTCYRDDVQAPFYRRIFAEYKDADGTSNVAETIVQAFENIAPRDRRSFIDYDASNNYFFRTFNMSKTIAQRYVNNIKSGVRYTGYTEFELNCIGHPEIEAGDRIRINNKNGSFVTYVLRRTLSGIKALKDNYTSE